MDRCLDASVARILSILEDGCTPQVARAALVACHGNVERAIFKILDSGPNRVELGDPFAGDGEAVIDLLESTSEPDEEARLHGCKRRRVSSESTRCSDGAASSPTAAQLRRITVDRAVDQARHAATSRLTLVQAPSHSSTARSSSGDARFSAQSEAAARYALRAQGIAQLEAAVALRRARCSGREEAPSKKKSLKKNRFDDSLQGELLVASANWILYDSLQVECPIPEVDPPCLTLRGHTADDVRKQSSGMRHIGSVDRDQTHRLESGVLARSSPNIQVKDKLLFDLFQDLVSEVRYPPNSIECCWRVQEVLAKGRKPCKLKALTPDDLQGTLPKRPFALLDNSNDSQAVQQPPNFKAHKLRPEQLRSLSWMLAREGHGVEGDGDEAEPFLVEWRRFWTPGHDMREAGNTPDQIVANAVVKLAADCSSQFVFEDIARGGAATIAADRLSGLEGRVIGIRAHSGPGVLNADVSFGAIGTINCATQDLEVVEQDGLYIGCLVQVRSDISTPKFGWGSVSQGMVGVVKSLDESANLTSTGPYIFIQFPTHENWKGLACEVERAGGRDSRPCDTPCTLDLRIRATYKVAGGILGDKIGYGKTATTIALIDSAFEFPMPPIPEPDRTAFIPAKGTLIIVPSNLLDQWLGEFSKFLWDGRSMKKAMQGGWSPKGCPLRIFAMTNVSPLTRIKAKELAEADVVICSYRLLFSQIYQERRSQLSKRWGGDMVGEDIGSLISLLKNTRDLIQGGRPMTSGRKGDVMVSNWEELAFPVLEMFYWRRVVFDEFHELESFESKQQNSLQHLRSHYRWGLTGTPPVSCNAGAIFMSSLFRVDLPGYFDPVESRLAGGYPDLAPWEGDRLMTEVAGRFLDHFVRQNTAELPHIGLEEHVVVVRHSATERALYLGQAHEAPDMSSEDAFATEANRQALERLLKLCSHFQAVGDTTSNAKDECLRIGDMKERRFVRARNQLHRCARVLVLLQAMLPGKKGEEKAKKAMVHLETVKAKLASFDNGAASVKALDDICAEVRLEGSEECYAVLNDHKPKCLELAAMLGQPDDKRKGYAELWMDVARRKMEPQEIMSILTSQVKEQASNLEEFAEAKASCDFFQRTLQALVADDSPSNRTCVVCLEDGFTLDKLSITPCAHAFCMPCLQMTVARFKSCSICRQQLSAKDIRPLSGEIVKKPTPSEEAASALLSAPSGSASSSSSSKPLDAAARMEAAMSEATAKHGTKLAAVVRKLQELRRDDPTAKAILFVQFDDLKKKISGALEDFGVPAAQLKGSVGQRSNIINDWQNNPNSTAFVLLLSLEQSASGTNLTAASHVVFLHPMLAATAEIALAHELQAIGRARRHGQTRSTVHVWRFVTSDTVEQAITERHQAALWERETARGALDAARALTNSSTADSAPTSSSSAAMPREGRQPPSLPSPEGDIFGSFDSMMDDGP